MTRGQNVHLFNSTFQFEARVERFTTFLAERGDFTGILLVGLRAPDTPDREDRPPGRRVLRVGPAPAGTSLGLGSFPRLLAWYRAVWRALADEDISCVNAHSVMVLPLSWAVARRARARLVYDTHELETETAAQRGPRRLASKLAERALAPRADLIVTTSDGCREWYERAYRHPDVIAVRNVARVPVGPIPPPPASFRERFAIAPDDRIVLYQGMLEPGRGIEALLDAFAQPPAGWHLVLMGRGSLEALAARRAEEERRIHLHPMVPHASLLSYTQGADLGACLTEDHCLNHRLTTPNKLFEYVAAGVPALVSDMPELRRVAEGYGMGWTVEPTAEAIRALLARLTAEMLAAARAAVRAAQAELDWAHEAERLRAAYDRLGLLREAAPPVALSPRGARA